VSLLPRDGRQQYRDREERGAGADGADEKPDEGRPLADPELADEQCAAESNPSTVAPASTVNRPRYVSATTEII